MKFPSCGIKGKKIIDGLFFYTFGMVLLTSVLGLTIVRPTYYITSIKTRALG